MKWHLISKEIPITNIRLSHEHSIFQWGSLNLEDWKMVLILNQGLGVKASCHSRLLLSGIFWKYSTIREKVFFFLLYFMFKFVMELFIAPCEQNMSTTTHADHEKMAANVAGEIFKCIFFNENVWFWLKFQWSLFLGVQLTICLHWFR